MPQILDGEPDRRRPRNVYRIGTEPDPRFTLANERTFLAWVRTALALVVTGIAITAVDDLLLDSPLFTGVAIGTCVFGAALSISSLARWARAEKALRLRRPLPALTSAPVLVIGVVLLGASGLVAAAVHG